MKKRCLHGRPHDTSVQKATSDTESVDVTAIIVGWLMIEKTYLEYIWNAVTQQCFPLNWRIKSTCASCPGDIRVHVLPLPVLACGTVCRCSFENRTAALKRCWRCFCFRCRREVTEGDRGTLSDWSSRAPHINTLTYFLYVFRCARWHRSLYKDRRRHPAPRRRQNWCICSSGLGSDIEW